MNREEKMAEKIFLDWVSKHKLEEITESQANICAGTAFDIAQEFSKELRDWRNADSEYLRYLLKHVFRKPLVWLGLRSADA